MTSETNPLARIAQKYVSCYINQCNPIGGLEEAARDMVTVNAYLAAPAQAEQRPTPIADYLEKALAAPSPAAQAGPRVLAHTFDIPQSERGVLPPPCPRCGWIGDHNDGCTAPSPTAEPRDLLDPTPSELAVIERFVNDAAPAYPYTFPPPKGGWVCFHCGKRCVTTAAAEEHFGTTDGATRACQIDVAAYRRQAQEIAELRTANSREYQRGRDDHARAREQADLSWKPHAEQAESERDAALRRAEALEKIEAKSSADGFSERLLFDIAEIARAALASPAETK